MSRDSLPVARPLLFGEVMLDQLPGGRSLIGGAPFNVAWHLQGFGLRPLLLTRVGEDVAGDWILRTMRDWGMDTDGVQVDPFHPTGSVQVQIDDDEVSRRVLGDQAYDHIEVEPALTLIGQDRWAAFYHGTLAGRTPDGWNTLVTLRAASEAPVFADANLRTPWWETEPVQQLLAGVRWLKLTRRELLHLSGAVMDDEPTVAAAAREMLGRYGLENLIVTEGAGGARFYTADRSGLQPALPAKAVVHPAGAGDAFSAVCLLGLALEWPLETLLARASGFAARLCMERSATPAERGLYLRFRREWLIQGAPRRGAAECEP